MIDNAVGPESASWLTQKGLAPRIVGDGGCSSWFLPELLILPGSTARRLKYVLVTTAYQLKEQIFS